MEQVELTASGVSTGVEVFNEIMLAATTENVRQVSDVELASGGGATALVLERSSSTVTPVGGGMSKLGRLQVVRAIGVAIVLKVRAQTCMSVTCMSCAAARSDQMFTHSGLDDLIGAALVCSMLTLVA